MNADQAHEEESVTVTLQRRQNDPPPLNHRHTKDLKTVFWWMANERSVEATQTGETWFPVRAIDLESPCICYRLAECDSTPCAFDFVIRCAWRHLDFVEATRKD